MWLNLTMEWISSQEANQRTLGQCTHTHLFTSDFGAYYNIVGLRTSCVGDTGGTN